MAQCSFVAGVGLTRYFLDTRQRLLHLVGDSLYADAIGLRDSTEDLGDDTFGTAEIESSQPHNLAEVKRFRAFPLLEPL